MRRRLKDAAGRNDTGSLSELAALFGDATEAGREARLLLAVRLMQKRAFLEADLRLQEVRRRTDDAVRSAQALEMLGRLMLARGQPADAVHYYRLLGQKHGATTLPDGRTGAEVWEAASTDKRLLPFLDPPDAFTGKLKARKQEGTFAEKTPVFQFEHDGEDVPFFRRHLLGFGLNDNKLRLLGPNTGESVWEHSISGRLFGPPVYRVKPAARLRYHTRGHLVVLAIDRVVLGFDPVARRILWEKDIVSAETANHPPQWNMIQPDPSDGVARVVYPNGWAYYLGQSLVLNPSVLCLTTHQGLQAFDPLTARLVWTRPDVFGRIFGDEEHVFVVEDDPDGKPITTRAYRLADGRALVVPDFTTSFARRRQTFGHFLLLSEMNEKGVKLRLHDILTGTKVWEAAYRPKSIVLHSEDPHLTGAVEPDGKVHVIDLRQRKEVMAGQMMNPADHLRNVQTVHLLADRKHFYLACSATDTDRENIVESNMMSESGLRDVPVNGWLYAFERGSGDVAWHIVTRHQRLLIHPFEDLPVIFLTARRKEGRNLPFGGRRSPEEAAVQSVEKWSGRILFANDSLKGESPFYAVRPDPASGTITFVSSHMKIVHYPQDAKLPANK